MKPTCWMIQTYRIDLRNVTLWSCVWTPDDALINLTLRVLRYCARLADFGEVLFFCCKNIDHSLDRNWKVVSIPRLTPEKWNVFVNREVPRNIRTQFSMSVHEDGFILDPGLWNYDFLSFDYIGAPWPDRVVGNQGFSIESRRMLQSKMRLPIDSGTIPSDNYLCRKHRSRLQNMGIRFAPAPLAEKFSTEMYGDDLPSFGFHGRNHSHRKYAIGWKLINQNE